MDYFWKWFDLVSGVVAGLIGSVKSGAAPAPENLVTNPSFTVNTADWSGNFPDAQISRNTTTFRSAPAALYYEGFDGDPFCGYSKANLLSIGSAYSLSLYIRTSNTQSFNIGLNAGTSSQTLTTPTQSSGTAWVNYKIENVTCAGNTTLSININSNAPAFVDDVSVVLGSTALVL
jgi:hypothetical protein